MAVTAVAIAPGWDDASQRHDVAVLTLAAPAGAPVPIATRAPAAGARAVAFGWGRGSASGIPPCLLQQVFLGVLADERCRPLDETGRSYDSATMMCAQPPRAGRGDTCQGDSGGPLMVDGAVVGVVSWGEDCTGAVPGAYADVVADAVFVARASAAHPDANASR